MFCLDLTAQNFAWTFSNMAAQPVIGGFSKQIKISPQSSLHEPQLPINSFAKLVREISFMNVFVITFFFYLRPSLQYFSQGFECMQSNFAATQNSHVLFVEVKGEKKSKERSQIVKNETHLSTHNKQSVAFQLKWRS